MMEFDIHMYVYEYNKVLVDNFSWVWTGMKTDRKTTLSFLYPHFIIENGIGSRIVENENGSRINGIVKTNGNGNTNRNS
jgi:hypothetical protein